MGRQKELLDRFELDPKGKIKKMSKGMKQKIGIVTAFGAGVPAFMFVLQMLANVGGKAEKVKYFTFFTLFDANGIVAGEVNAFLYSIVLLVGAIVLFGIGIEIFCRKDLCL